MCNPPINMPAINALMLVTYESDVRLMSFTVGRIPHTPMAIPNITNRMYNHWNEARGAMLSHLVGNKAAHVVPIPPSRVNPPVSPISTIPMKRRDFEKNLRGLTGGYALLGGIG